MSENRAGFLKSESGFCILRNEWFTWTEIQSNLIMWFIMNFGPLFSAFFMVVPGSVGSLWDSQLPESKHSTISTFHQMSPLRWTITQLPRQPQLAHAVLTVLQENWVVSALRLTTRQFSVANSLNESRETDRYIPGSAFDCLQNIARCFLWRLSRCLCLQVCCSRSRKFLAILYLLKKKDERSVMLFQEY